MPKFLSVRYYIIVAEAREGQDSGQRKRLYFSISLEFQKQIRRPDSQETRTVAPDELAIAAPRGTSLQAVGMSFPS